MKELKVHLLQLLCMEFVYGLVEGALFALVVCVYVLIDWNQLSLFYCRLCFIDQLSNLIYSMKTTWFVSFVLKAE